MADLESAGYRAPVTFMNLPPHVFTEYRSLQDGRLAVHLVNYAPESKVEGVTVRLNGASCEFLEPFADDGSARPVAIGEDGRLPAFGLYATLVIKL